MKFGEGDLQSRDARGVHIGGDTSAVIADGDVAVLVDKDKDISGKSANSFVKRVVNNFGS